jgi:hypothetical protein
VFVFGPHAFPDARLCALATEKSILMFIRVTLAVTIGNPDFSPRIPSHFRQKTSRFSGRGPTPLLKKREKDKREIAQENNRMNVCRKKPVLFAESDTPGKSSSAQLPGSERFR